MDYNTSSDGIRIWREKKDYTARLGRKVPDRVLQRHSGPHDLIVNFAIFLKESGFSM